MTRDELIAILEKAERGSAELSARAYILALQMQSKLRKQALGMDADIEAVEYCHTVPQYRRHPETGCTVPHMLVRVMIEGREFFEAWDDIPPFTTSRDAMIPGVPAGVWNIRQSVGLGPQWQAVYTVVPVLVDQRPWELREYTGTAHTEPLARCIAQLRALPEDGA